MRVKYIGNGPGILDPLRRKIKVFPGDVIEISDEEWNTGMNEKVCPECRIGNRADAKKCRKCDADLKDVPICRKTDMYVKYEPKKKPKKKESVK